MSNYFDHCLTVALEYAVTVTIDEYLSVCSVGTLSTMSAAFSSGVEGTSGELVSFVYCWFLLG